jgi:hypothetical protein
MGTHYYTNPEECPKCKGILQINGLIAECLDCFASFKILQIELSELE